MTRRKSFMKVVTIILAGAILVGTALGTVAARGEDAVGRDDELPLAWGPTPGTRLPEPELPPNCEYVTVQGEPLSFSYLQCDLPPECEYVTVYGEPLSFTYIECDLEPGCELKLGDWNGTPYWYIECHESECLGGCNPTVPDGIGFKSP